MQKKLIHGTLVIRCETKQIGDQKGVICSGVSGWKGNQVRSLSDEILVFNSLKKQ